MKLFVNVKQAGTRKNFITQEEIILDSKPSTLRELIGAIITKNVENFNNKITEEKLIDYLTKEEIDDKLTLGKVSFNELHNKSMANLNKALEEAYIAYEDGLYRVFIDNTEAGKLDGQFELKDESVLTFIRFTMLSGRMW